MNAGSNSRAKLPRVVVWLGVVSFATDASTEMIYPLLPLFLTSVLHAGASFVGVIEGAAEATASLLKLVSGRLADRARSKKPLTVIGYGVSSLARPLTGLATHPWMVLVVRLTDRFGKGVRSSPRDALLAESTPPEHRGRAYGFHSAMDNAGALVGPAIASALLVWRHLSLRAIFLWAAVPGALAMVSLVLGVREPARGDASDSDGKSENLNSGSKNLNTRSNFSAADPPPLAPADAGAERRLLRYFGVLALFALGNSSDAFLLLRARQLGVAEWLIPFLWMVHNGTKAALGTLGGSLSDRLGRRRLIIAGWAIYGAAYLGFGWADASWQMWALFVFYGLYYALVEGSERALVADLAPAARRGRAFGLYYAIVGLIALPASLGFGALAERVSARAAFTVAAALAVSASLLLALMVREPRRPRAPASS